MEHLVDEHLVSKLTFIPSYIKSHEFSLRHSNVSLTLEALLFFLTLLWLLTKFWQKGSKIKDLVKNEEKLNNVPTLRWSRIPIPIFDSFYTLYLLRKNGVRLLDTLREKYGLFFKLPLGFTEFYFVADADVAQKILSSSNPGHLTKERFFYAKFFVGETKNGLVSSEVATWAGHRKILNRAFTFKSLQGYLPTMNKYSQSLCESLTGGITNYSGGGHGGLVKEELHFYTLKIISEIMMGSKTEISTDEERRLFHADFVAAKKLQTYRLLYPWFLFDTLWWFHPKKWETDRILKRQYRFIYKIIDEFKAKMKTDIEQGKIWVDPGDDEVGLKPFRCMLEEMLHCQMEDREILSEVLTVMMAGYETTGVAMNLLLFHLALNRNEQLKCREEIDSVYNSKSEPGPDLTMDDLANLKHLERCIYESLRMTPIFPVFLRTMDVPLKVNDDLVLEQGANVEISPWAMHRSSKYYPDPEKFDSDRFLPANCQNRSNFAYLAWSAGKRNCIGWRFSLIEMKIMVAFVLRNFEVYTNDKLEGVKFQFDVSLIWEKPIDLKLTKRGFK